MKVTFYYTDTFIKEIYKGDLGKTDNRIYLVCTVMYNIEIANIDTKYYQ